MDNDQRRSVLLSMIHLATMLEYQDTEHGLSDNYVDAIIRVNGSCREALEEIIDSQSNESDEPESTPGDGLTPETFKTIEV